MAQIPKLEDYGLNTETGFLPDIEPPDDLTKLTIHHGSIS